MPATRTLTHSLIYDKWKGHWSCDCGYVLGMGHDELYAQCPKAGQHLLSKDGKTAYVISKNFPEPLRAKKVRHVVADEADAYIEFDITTTHEKKPTTTKAHIPSPPKRQVGRRVARIHRKGPSLSDS